MKQKLFLTSAIAMGFVAPAFAEPTHTGNFPSNGYMQEDYTYTNAATSTNMAGVTEGEVNAVAEYENVLYELAAGKYLPQSSETPIDCNQSGYYCPGDQNGVYYSTSGNQGLSQCPSGYASSDTGASSEDDCYRACTVANANIAHASAVSGNDYYGNGTDTCAPTSCDPGYHVKDATPDLMTVIGASEAATGYTSNDSNGDESETDGMDNEYVILGDPMAFAMDFGNKGIVKGHGRCSTRSATEPWGNDTYNVISGNFVTDLANQTGQSGAKYCYCHLDSYIPVSGTAIAVSGSWLFQSGVYSDAGNCADNCAGDCVRNLGSGTSETLAFRTAMFNAYPASSAMCEANTITINWTDVDSETAGQNNEGTATYGGNINTPKAAETKPGQRFKGWRFVAPTPVQVGNN